jgi:hypothetical protein
MIHPAIRRLVSCRGPVCFGDVTSGQPTPKPDGDLLAERRVRAVLDFVNRFAPPGRQFKTMEEVAADRSLFGTTSDEEQRLWQRARDMKPYQYSHEREKKRWEDFTAERAWVAAAIMTFRRFGYEGLADPDGISDSERHKSQY